MIEIELTGNAAAMTSTEFATAYEKASKAKRELEDAIMDLKKMGIKVDVLYLKRKYKR